MTLADFLATISQLNPKQYDLKYVSETTPLFPCLILDDGHASLAVITNTMCKKKYSYAHLTEAFTFRDEDSKASPA
jgi:hypothetical protein